MVVTCAFYGFVNRTTKVTLQVDRDKLEVGQLFGFEGEHYVILSVFEADGHYHANVGRVFASPPYACTREDCCPRHVGIR